VLRRRLLRLTAPHLTAACPPPWKFSSAQPVTTAGLHRFRDRPGRCRSPRGPGPRPDVDLPVALTAGRGRAILDQPSAQQPERLLPLGLVQTGDERLEQLT